MSRSSAEPGAGDGCAAADAAPVTATSPDWEASDFLDIVSSAAQAGAATRIAVQASRVLRILVPQPLFGFGCRLTARSGNSGEFPILPEETPNSRYRYSPLSSDRR